MEVKSNQIHFKGWFGCPGAAASPAQQPSSNSAATLLQTYIRQHDAGVCGIWICWVIDAFASHLKVVANQIGAGTGTVSGANWAHVVRMEPGSSAYGVHPAMGDSSIHLAAVPLSGADIEHVR